MNEDWYELSFINGKTAQIRSCEITFEELKKWMCDKAILEIGFPSVLVNFAHVITVCKL